MGKYDRLETHLRRQKKAAVHEMSFRDIERLISVLLPRRAYSAVWWVDDAAAEPPPHVRAWRRAGYRADLLADERVRFTRIQI